MLFSLRKFSFHGMLEVTGQVYFEIRECGKRVFFAVFHLAL